MVTTDLSHPGMRGLDFLSKFKKIRPNIPVIVVSAVLDVGGNKEHADALDAFACLAKPFTPEEFHKLVQEALEWRSAGSARKPAEVPVFDGAMKALNDLMEALSRRIKGSLRLVRASDPKRVLVLIDEYHLSLEVVMQNIANAGFLIEETGSGLVGLEGFAGGSIFDMKSRTYSEKRHDSQIVSRNLIVSRSEDARRRSTSVVKAAMKVWEFERARL